MTKVFYYSFVLCAVLPCLQASSGDHSLIYRHCLKDCLKMNCTDDGSHYKQTSLAKQDAWALLFLWNCRDECGYECMWYTVEEFRIRGLSAPKFHGKWPFTRFLFVQEPKAAFASVLNFASNYYMYKHIKRRWQGQNVPLFRFWQGFSLVSMNTWVWSTVFHSRDTYFTEFMDYAGAMLLLLAFLLAAVARIFYKWWYVSYSVGVVLFVFYVDHCLYLYTGRIDYEYNMAANVVLGVIGSILWSIFNFLHMKKGHRYTVRMVAFTALSAGAAILEMLDFPPILSGWDAHAVWHLVTAPFPLLLCKFVTDDLEYLQLEQDAAIKLA